MLLLCFLVGMLIFLISVCVYLYMSGIFFSPKINIGPAPFEKILICYKFYQRPYEDIRHAFTEMQTLLKSNKKCKFIGIYYDDPDKIARNKLRHIVGAVLGNPDNGPIDKESQEILEKHGYKTITLPKISTAVLSRFPTFTGLSLLLAVNYVYPLAKEFVEKNKLSPNVFIEYYPGKETQFVFPIGETKPFFVDEYKKTFDEDPYYSEIEKKTE